MHYAIFDCIRVQRFYLTAWRLEFAQRGSPLVNERSTFFYEVFKYYLILLKNPQKNSIADTHLWQRFDKISDKIASEAISNSNLFFRYLIVTVRKSIRTVKLWI